MHNGTMSLTHRKMTEQTSPKPVNTEAIAMVPVGKYQVCTDVYFIFVRSFSILVQSLRLVKWL